MTLVEMPWRVAGKKLAPAPAVIDECYTAVLDDMRTRSPLVARWAQRGRPVGVPDRPRRRGARRAGAVVPAAPARQAGEVPARRAPSAPGCPTLVVQGERDPFGTPEEFPDDVDLAVVPAADHSMKVPKSADLSQADALAVVLEATLEWVVREIAGNRNG